MRFPVSKPALLGREREYVLDAIDSNWISSAGKYVSAFEAELGRRVGVEEPIATANGTVALHLACLAMGLSAGDEVIVPTLTYVASANAVAYCNARPVFADADPSTWNVTVESIEAALTPRTVGVLAVHLYGLPCPIEEIAALCKAKGLWLIEDCAESLGATVDGRWTGGFGDAATFSFYGNKTISTGEGGAVYIRDPEKRRLARMLKGQGMDLQRRYWHPVLGYNYRMTNVAAAIGVGQLEMVDHHLAERRRVASAYESGLRSAQDEGELLLPAKVQGYESSAWLTCAVLQKGGADRRGQIEEHLLQAGIETRPFFVPMHRLPMYPAPEGSYPVAERLGSSGINLPTYSGLAGHDIAFIAAKVLEALKATANR